jgi:hypothetical protein
LETEGDFVAFTEIEIKRCEREISRFLDRRRPPPEIRNELDIGYRISGHSVELFEVRPVWDDRSRKSEHSFAKATFVRTVAHWRIYWMRQDLKWHGYQPVPNVATLKEFLEIVDHDEFCCFFG